MAEMTPWQVAGRKTQTVKRVPVYARDPYNFSSVSASSGTNHPRVCIPATGPNAIGAPPPVSVRTVESYIVTVTGTNASDYGNNLHTPTV